MSDKSLIYEKGLPFRNITLNKQRNTTSVQRHYQALSNVLNATDRLEETNLPEIDPRNVERLGKIKPTSEIKSVYIDAQKKVTIDDNGHDQKKPQPKLTTLNEPKIVDSCQR